MTSFDSIAAGHCVMAILRGLPPAKTAALANRVWDAGIRLVEVPIASPHAVPALRAAVRAGACTRWGDRCP